MGVPPVTITLSDTLPKILLPVSDLMFCWPRGLSSKESNASTSRHNSDFIELEIKTITWSLWVPHASESSGKEKSYCCLGRLVLSVEGKSDCSSAKRVSKSRSEIQKLMEVFLYLQKMKHLINA